MFNFLFRTIRYQEVKENYDAEMSWGGVGVSFEVESKIITLESVLHG